MSEPKSTFWELFGKIESDHSGPSPIWSLFGDPKAAAGDSAPPPALSKPTFREDKVFWAMRYLPASDATNHFLISGMTGSGKTIAIKLFLQSIAPRFSSERERPEQLIIFDAKGDAIPLLAALGLRHEDPNVWILNPIDQRSAVWNLAEAIRTPLMARHLATLLVPPEKESNNPYFTDAARELAYAVLIALNDLKEGEWTLRDLLCALDSYKRIRDVTARHPRATRLVARVLEDAKHGYGVVSTLATKLGRFEQVAALWQSSPTQKPFSIREFLKHPGVLILGNDPVLRDSFWPINAILLKALTQEILGRPDSPGLRPRYWFVLDEFRAMERVDCIHDLLNRGRSKGAAVVLGIQSVEGLIELYGEHAANDLLGQCAQKMFLRAGEPKTAEWAEKFFGQVRRIEPERGESTGRQGKTTSVNYQLRERPLFLASYFLSLPLPAIGRSYLAVCDVPSLQRTLIFNRPFNEVLSWCPDSSSVESVVPRIDDDGQSLQPWTAKEEKTYCGTAAARAAKRKKRSKRAVKKSSLPTANKGQPWLLHLPDSSETPEE